ncbi:DUF481 domain-containing protein [Aestuariibaculum sp. M13]|uniref:DUF481 domain-containing protein n=1 Tax=Aestuariibaculum sp. M13 TaxID=2967132 RepID=UPI002159CE28|nr:DUF481 domain-containing protein [Aestuariibaculum sp. M13]MCR8668106.1 DUF481 domain-containing protein [Aestuariibaculum sp. M13]
MGDNSLYKFNLKRTKGSIVFNGLSKIIIVVILLFGYSVLAQNDTLVLKNNNRIVGEIKSMQNGVLAVETDYSDSDFKITWVEVAQVSGKQLFLVTLKNGERYNTALSLASGTGKVKLTNVGDGRVVSIQDIVFIKSVKSSFLSRLDASISVGFNLTKSNNLRQLNVRSSVGYAADYWQLLGNYNSVRSKQDGSSEIHRTDANIKFTYFLKNDMLAIFNSEYLANDEQKIDYRFTNRVGFGNYFIHTNYLYFGAAAGLALNNERFSDDVGTNRNSLEAFGSLELNLFDVKDFNLLTNIIAYPSITEKNRLRVDYTLDLKYDLPLDFFIKFGVTYNFDNQPVQDASKDDYVFQATFGWEL